MSRGPRSAHGGTPASGALPLDWIAADQRGAGILDVARHLMAAEALLAQVLPPGLARYCKAALIDRQRLTISVPSPAHAARLRQLAPTAAAHLRAAGWPVEDIVVRIDAGLARLTTKQPLRQAEGLGEHALDSFEALRRSLRPGPLADAIGRLLRHHRQ
ncbi:DciA family protein [Castellaniella sp. GW247-6E4]|uniref:DciA family protein n=1 Tax=Castellaniella sp. GW247-6E4 TaxID=3140380 RepID=UPI003315675A